MRMIHGVEQHLHWRITGQNVTDWKGTTPMSVAEKIKQFVDEHAPELETLLTDAEHAAVAIDPALAPVVGLFGELADGAKALAADVIRALHTSSVASTVAPAEPAVQ